MRIQKTIAGSLAGLLVLSGLLAVWMPLVQSVRIVFGSVYVLFLPGFAWTYAFFSDIDIIERVALSFALSIAIVPLTIFYLSLLGMPLRAWTVSLVVLLVIMAGVAVTYRKSLCRLLPGKFTTFKKEMIRK
ncbi:MAG: DUF1616 domain-containing protein [Nanoarchaeota archaeon]